MIEVMEAETTAVINEKPYTLRDIEADDLDYLTAIIDKIGVDKVADCIDKDMVKDIVGDKEDKESKSINDTVLNALGIKVMTNVAAIIIKNYKIAKDDIYSLLAALSGMEKDAIAHLKLPEYVGMIIEVCKKDEFIESFKVASSLLK